SNGNQDVVVVPHAALPDGTAMTVAVAGVEDLAGNAVVAKTAHFTTGTGPQLAAPAVIAQNPVSGATGVPVNVAISVQVNEPVDPGTVTNSTFVVNDNSVGPVAGSVSVSADGQTINFVPNAPLGVGR